MKRNKIQQVFKLLQDNPKIKPTEVMAKLGTAKSYTYVLMSKARNLHKRTTKAPMQASGVIGELRDQAWRKGIQLAHDIQATPDAVNHPSHYKVGGIETIDFIEAKKLGYNLGNVVKYITRADHKGNKLEDLRKAQWYLTREIEAAK
jgi:hypothetical protein